jgi:serine/threonine-protein kinase RsbW
VPDRPETAVRLVFAADPLSVRAALARLMAAQPLSGTGADDRATVELVLAEVLNNIAEHAYVGRSGLVEVDLTRQTGGLACQICDQGGPMPGGQPPPGQVRDLAGLPLADLPEGGFGWSLIRSLTRGLTYRRDGDWNRLCFLIPLRG